MVVIFRSPRPKLKPEGYSDKQREAILAVYPELEAELLALPTWSSAERHKEKQRERITKIKVEALAQKERIASWGTKKGT